jgi:hypothetical protein
MGGKTRKHQQLILLEHEKADLLDKLAKDRAVPKQTLLREAIDDLLVKFKRLKRPKP